jgi:Domain of Unknown Function with PDB structure (DUF3857)/Transglutaminase-like superfamily
MTIYRSFALLFVLLVCLLLVSPGVLAQQWKPIDPAHLELKAPVVEKDADAEVLLWEVYINDSSPTTTDFIHFLRIKVFNDRGKESQSKIDLPYFTGVQIRDISGRTVKPDGSIIELKKDAIFDRELVKLGRFKYKAKSFAMPGIEPGSIIEYRYKEVHENGANYVKLYFQQEIPVHVVRYYLKPYPYAEYPMKAMTFQGKPAPFTKEKDGYYRIEMTNMPAFREEPRMPPEDQVRTWMLVYYAPDQKKESMAFWKDRGKLLYETYKGEMKFNDEVRKAAAETIGDAQAPEQKLERLYNYCRTKIRNVMDDASGLTPDQLKKMKENKSASDTFKRGYGTGPDINFLFAAMASAAGFDARYAALSDRSRKFFDAGFTDPYFMRAYNIAVKVGDQWRFFDPGSNHTPFGMLRWQEEGVQALITDSKEPFFERTPLSPPEKSKKKRVAKLRLTDDGMLEGEVRIEYTGHFAVEMKEDNDEESPAVREEKLRESVTSRMSTALLSEIKVESSNDPSTPFVYSYKVRVPGYAERTGKRLFLQTAFFQKNVGQLFPTSGRENDVYFSYSWTEEDHVTIDLPRGYTLDNADSPGSFNFGQVGSYTVKLGVAKDQPALVYQRNLIFDGLLFPKTAYGDLKKVFDAIHQEDNHAISLKQDPAAEVKQ